MITGPTRLRRVEPKGPVLRCGSVTDRTAKLEAALRVNAALLVQAERLIGAYIAPESDKTAIINELIRLLDGPAQREAKRLAEIALVEARGEEEPPWTLRV